MQIVLRSDSGERELDVECRSPDATIGDVLRAELGPHAPAAVFVDDRLLPADCPISEAALLDGSVLRPQRGSRGAEARARSGLELVAVSGLRAGQAIALGPSASIGRHPANSVVLDAPRVSRRHCTLERTGNGTFRVTDAGSSNGTFVDGCRLATGETAEVGPGSILEVGAVAFALRPFEIGDRPRALASHAAAGTGGHVAFNRPPRPARPSAPGPVAAPDEPPEREGPTLTLAHTLGPIVVAVIMVAVSGDMRFALFALLSPLIAVAAHVEASHRARKEGVASMAGFAGDVANFQRAVQEACAGERARRWAKTPDPAECVRRAAVPSSRLWERRPHHDDFLRLFAGVASFPWQPPLAGTQTAERLPAVAAETLAAAHLHAAPVEIDLARGEVIGVVGDRAAALAVGRSLVCQAAVHHGPADLTIGVFVDPGREVAWDWAKWLPHTLRGDDGSRWLGAARPESNALLSALAEGAGGPVVLAVVDSDVLTDGPQAPARTLLGGRPAGAGPGDDARRRAACGIVIARTTDQLPAACTTIIDVDEHGEGSVSRPDEGTVRRRVLLAGISTGTARRCARHLAAFEDPEIERPGSALPDGVKLLSLLDLDAVDPASIARLWRRAGDRASVSTPLGVGEEGVFTVDLIRDGPHALIGGTTGSGKSELLRSLVVGLAARADVRRLTFVLVDFKGGAAFDACERLPHVVGMVTDLENPRHAERALVALDAEVHQRERMLREAGVADIAEHLVSDPDVPLPRLVVVIDEFATMAKQYPEMLRALVSIAQRGRTLGIHLVLATQRPSGVVDEDIRTNTDLRIALRVQDPQDSHDVIDRPDAAAISRLLPGRAFVRLGPAQIVPVQTALVTSSQARGEAAAVDVRAFRFGPAARADASDGRGADAPAAADSDLVRLVDAIAAAHEHERLAAPRRPWPEPLPPELPLAALLERQAAPTAGTLEAVVALADDPARQRQAPLGWDAARGNLLLVGIPGSGTTTALASIALSLAARHPPDDVALYAFDFGAGELAALEGLAHVGSVVTAADRERQIRLIRRLRAELDRRRAEPSSRRVVVLLDNLAAMRAEYDDAAGTALMDELARVYADGPGVGISFAVSADRLGSVQSSWASVTAQKWLFQLADAYDYASAGVSPRDAPEKTPGRAVTVEGGLLIQVGHPGSPLAEAVAATAAHWPAPYDPPEPVAALPAEVRLSRLGAVAVLGQEPWCVPYGVREADFGPAELVLYEGEHALVAGPGRSGKSTTLLTLAESLRSGDRPVHVAASGAPRSPLRSASSVDRFAPAGGEATAMLSELRLAPGPVVLLLDDAERVTDSDQALLGLLALGRPDLHVVAAGRADGLRTLYVDWIKAVKQARAGVLLRPDLDLDGELLSLLLPRRSPVAMAPGRGYAAVDGVAQLVQVALPSPPA